jgi:hypothetical protein
MLKSLLTASLLLAAPAAFAQTGFRFGPQLGLTYSVCDYSFPDTRSSDKTSTSFRAGMQSGIQVQYDFAAHFGLHSGLLFSQKGTHLENTYVTNYPNSTYVYNEAYDFRFNYLLLPLCLQYSSAEDGQGLLLLAGPYVGLLTGGDYKSSFSTTVSGNNQGGGGDSGNVAAGDTYNTSYTHHTYYSRGLDAGWQLGMGVGVKHVQVQLVYSYGLRNLGAAYAGGTAAPTYHNRCFTLSAAYLFGGKQ